MRTLDQIIAETADHNGFVSSGVVADLARNVAARDARNLKGMTAMLKTLDEIIKDCQPYFSLGIHNGADWHERQLASLITDLAQHVKGLAGRGSTSTDFPKESGHYWLKTSASDIWQVAYVPEGGHVLIDNMSSTIARHLFPSDFPTAIWGPKIEPPP